MGTLKVDTIEPGVSGTLNFNGTINGSSIDQLDASHITTGRLTGDRFQVVTQYDNIVRTQFIHTLAGSWVNRINITFNNFGPISNTPNEYVYICGFNAARGTLPNGANVGFLGETNPTIQQSLTPLTATLGQTAALHNFPATVTGFNQASCIGNTTIDILRDYAVPPNGTVFQGCTYTTQALFQNTTITPESALPYYYSIAGRNVYGANENDPIDSLIFDNLGGTQFQGGFTITEMA